MTMIPTTPIQQADLEFNNFAEYLRVHEGITMVYEYNFSSAAFSIRLSKDNWHTRQIIDTICVQNNLHMETLKNVVSLFKTNMQQQSAVGAAVNPNMSIPLPDDWLPKELNMTQTQFDMEKIKIMKESARLVMNNPLVNGILAGGCFTSWYHQEVPKDFDVFVIDEQRKDTVRRMAIGNSRFIISDSAYLNNGNIEEAILDTQTNIQYILVKYKTRKEIIDHFDAEHTAVSYDLYEDKLYISASTYECIKNKILKPHNGNKIVHWREHKFKHKGFKLHETVSV